MNVIYIIFIVLGVNALTRNKDKYTNKQLPMLYSGLFIASGYLSVNILRFLHIPLIPSILDLVVTGYALYCVFFYLYRAYLDYKREKK